MENFSFVREAIESEVGNTVCGESSEIARKGLQDEEIFLLSLLIDRAGGHDKTETQIELQAYVTMFKI